MSLPNVTATIPSGTYLSGVVPLAGKLSGIFVPALWTPAPLSFITSPDFGTTWGEFCQQGNELVLPVPVFDPATNVFVGVEWRFWGGVTAVMVRSGSVGATVNQTAQRVLTLTQQA